MNYNHPVRNSSTVGIRLMCAIVFLLFATCWIVFFQSDMLAAAQHVFSKGMTAYNRLVAPIIIVGGLQLLQLVVYATVRLRKRSHALTYFPSMLLLALLTDMSDNYDTGFALGHWWWAFPLAIMLWAPLMWLAYSLQDIEPSKEPCGLFSRAMLVNMVTMLMMIAGMVLISNTDAVLHYRLRAEAALLKKDYEGALKAGEKSLESDASLQMVRMYALSQRGEMGERLFRYPIVAGSETMLPTGDQSHTTLYPQDSIYRYFGARPAAKMLPARYLKAIARRDTTVSRKVGDYELCGLLIDRQLDQFVRLLPKYYTVSDQQEMDCLPRHYREALILYTHLRKTPQIVYHNSVMDEDFNNLQELEDKYPDKRERKGKVEEQYRGTYWYYYEYE